MIINVMDYIFCS